MGRKLIKNNINTVISILFDKFKLNLNAGVLSRLKEHPNFPSFLSIQHTLKQEGVNSIALKTNIDSLRNELPKPVLVHIATNTDLFLLVDHIDDSDVHIITEKGRIELEPIENFIKIWDGYAMIFDSENIAPRKIYFQERVLLLFEKLKVSFLIFATSSLLVFYLLRYLDQRDIYNYLYTIFSVIGLIFSALLVVEGFDEHNPIVQKFCTSSKSEKINCASIVNSKDANFLGVLSWSDIGVVYFSFIFLLNFFKPETISYAITGILSALSFPYVFYSITYQKFVARSWCRLCLGVQAMITALFIVSVDLYIAFGIELNWTIKKLIPTFLIFLTICASYIFLKQLLTKSYELKGIISGYRSLKHDSEIKQILIKRQQKVNKTPDSCIVLGNPGGKTNITLVISPVCNPCINELKILIPILKRKEDTRIELVFLTDKKDNDPLAFNLAMMLVDKYHSNPNEFISELWIYIENYPSSKYRYKDYKHCQKYELIEEMLLEQISWSISNKLYSTPAIFIDGHLLSNIYSTMEIDFLCI